MVDFSVYPLDELRIFFRCDEVINQETKQTIWKGPSGVQYTILPIYPMDILCSSSKLRFLKQQVYLRLQEEYFVKRLTPPNHHINLYRCKMQYEDELSHIYGITEVDIDTPSNNKHILSYFDENNYKYYEIYITITLSIGRNK